MIKPLRAGDPVEAAIQRRAGEWRLRLARLTGPIRRRGWKPIRTMTADAQQQRAGETLELGVVFVG